MMHNWKKFMTLLHERTLNGFEYDVYVGVSGYTKVPLELKHKMDFRPKRLIYYPQRIPKYIWAYLNTTSSSKEAERLIVIGVNSIFVTKGSFEDYSLCKDVCDKFKWLEPLSITRHMAAFGYMYCCHLTNNIRKLLEGFSNLHCPETMFIDPECGMYDCN
uniref:Uncharacterized protein n=1 Tax=Megaselia scalaris TaxID=36166 RepID=T1H252_MEGSC